jgi:uncharacterized protein YoxC
MTSQDVLHYSLAFSALALTGGILYLLYYLVQTIKQMQKVIEDVNSVTHDLEAMKDSLKHGVVGKLITFTNFFSRKKE